VLATEEIYMSAYNNDCALATIINLFKLRGLKPPSFDEVNQGLYQVAQVVRRGASVIGDQEAPTVLEVQTFLALTDFLSAQIIIPQSFWKEPQKILTRFLDEGCHLIIFYNWRDSETKEIITHVTLCEGHNEQGYSVIDGMPGYFPEGKLIELEPPALFDEQIKGI
jgi:hypothetical protein